MLLGGEKGKKQNGRRPCGIRSAAARKTRAAWGARAVRGTLLILKAFSIYSSLWLRSVPRQLLFAVSRRPAGYFFFSFSTLSMDACAAASSSLLRR